jgi:hypothetical protein
MMTKFILLCLIGTYSNWLFAQTTSVINSNISSETALNQQLLDNAAQSRKIIEDAKANGSATTGSGLTTQKTSKANLTDQEKQLSENYVDQAAANKILKEKCVGEMVQGCKGNEVDHTVMGMSPTFIKVATQMYATMNVMGDFLPINKGDSALKADAEAAGPVKDSTAKATDKVDKTKKEKATDYCKYIPTLTEGVAAITQQANIKSLDSQLNNGGDTSQKEMLLKAAKSHESRSDLAQLQAVGWYGGAACYAGMAVSGQFATDTALVVKLGAATLLGTFYQAEVAANKDYAQKTRDIANSIPGKGACNPVTENTCYCSEPEHENDPNFCKVQIAAKAAKTSGIQIACTDSNLKADPNCICERSNSCFDKIINNIGSTNSQIGPAFSMTPFKPIASMAKGKLEASTLSSQAYAATSAIAKKALNELATKLPINNNPLTLAQKEIADAITSKGIPANVAKLMAQNPPSQSALDSAKTKVANLSSNYEETNNQLRKSNILDFSGGNGLGSGGRKEDKKGNSMDDFLGKINPKAQTTNGKVIEFAQKAQSQVPQITKSDRAIFDIISNRYQTSGRRLLQIDTNN